jgi:hypothetical protein
MRNIEEVSYFKTGSYRTRIHGEPPLRGWAVMYISGMEAMPDTKAGDWLSLWDKRTEDIIFKFENGRPHMCFEEEAQATGVVEKLWEEAEIETEVVKI